MKYGKIVSSFAAALAVVLTGCGPTSPSLNPPAPESAAIPPQKYLGKWEDGEDKAGNNPELKWSITLKDPDKKDHYITLRIEEPPEEMKKGFPAKTTPLSGYFFKAGDKTFLTLYADLEPLYSEKELVLCDGWGKAMLPPCYFVFEIAQESADRITLDLVTFFESKDKVIPDGLKYFSYDPENRKTAFDHIVLNTTDEIYSFLKAGKYTHSRINGKPVFSLKKR